MGRWRKEGRREREGGGGEEREGRGGAEHRQIMGSNWATKTEGGREQAKRWTETGRQRL